MFTSVIGALTSLLPKYFIFGCYVPVLIFSFINFGMVYLFSAWTRFEIEFWLGKSLALSVSVAFVATVVIAYVVSAINDFLREFLEGRYVWPSRLERLLCVGERRRRDDLGQKYTRARRQRFVLSQLHYTWEKDLRNAAMARKLPAAGPYTLRPLEDLRAAVSHGALNGKRDPLSDSEFTMLRDVIQNAVDKLVLAMGTYSTPEDTEVENDRRELLLLIGAISNSMKQLEFETGADLYTRFGNDPVRPTRLGNIAAAIHAYSIGRYKMELTIFFSRLQTVLVKKEDKGYPLVLDAKAQLDFLIACCWFSALSTAIWGTLLFGFGGSREAFLIVAAAGFLLTLGFYLSAGANYLAYGEVVRAAIDVNRFSLLNALDIKLPGSLREERSLWAAMSGLAYSGGESVEFSYEHPAKP